VNVLTKNLLLFRSATEVSMLPAFPLTLRQTDVSFHSGVVG